MQSLKNKCFVKYPVHPRCGLREGVGSAPNFTCPVSFLGNTSQELTHVCGNIALTHISLFVKVAARWQGRCHLSSHSKAQRWTATPWNTNFSWARQSVRILEHAFMCGQHATLIYEQGLHFDHRCLPGFDSKLSLLFKWKMAAVLYCW